MIMVIKEIAPSKKRFTHFFAEEWKFARKINRINYAKLARFNFGNFCPRYMDHKYKESLASIN